MISHVRESNKHTHQIRDHQLENSQAQEKLQLVEKKKHLAEDKEKPSRKQMKIGNRERCFTQNTGQNRKAIKRRRSLGF